MYCHNYVLKLFSFRLRLGKLLFSFLLLLLLLLRLRVIPDLSYVSDLSCLFLIMVKSFFLSPGDFVRIADVACSEAESLDRGL